MTINSVKYYADRDNISVRKAQRYRAKLKLGSFVGGKTGVWLLTEDEWQKVKSACMDASLKRWD